MKSLLLICAFVAVVVAQKSQVCFPDVFRTDEITFVPERRDMFINRIWYDIKVQRERFDVDVEVEKGKVNPQRLEFLFDYPNAKWYEVVTNTSTHTQTCTIHTLSGKLDRLCLSRHARHRGSPIEGGVLILDNWVEEEHRPNDTVIHLDILADRNVNVPVRVHIRNEKSFAVQEYWDFEERVDPDVFRVPSVCQSVKVVKSAPQSFQQVMSYAYKNSHGFVPPFLR
jgi:hypothetical protein